MSRRLILQLLKHHHHHHHHIPQTHNNYFNTHPFSTTTTTTTTRTTTTDTIYTRISLITSPTSSLVPVLDRWLDDGNRISTVDLRDVIRGLRSRKRFNQALEVSEWMSNKRVCPFSLGDGAIQLDLIGKVRGVAAAETYFNNLTDKPDKIYGALLNCYVREGLLDKSLSLFQKMKEMGIARSSLTYNDIMCLYLNTEQLEKIPDVFSEMKADGVIPNTFSYIICLNSYGSRSDFQSIDKLLNEVEGQPHMPIHWSIYTTAANLYLEAGFEEKALYYAKKAEEKVDKDGSGYNRLIILYKRLRNKSEIMRLWDLKKATSRRLNNADYSIMLDSLNLLGEIEELENLFQEWQSAGTLYDFRVPNWLLIGYTKRGLVEKAEKFLEKIMDEGRAPVPNCWSIIAAAHVNDDNMEKALDCMGKAITLQPQHDGWYPNPKVVSSILVWLRENGDVERMNSFVESLRRIMPTNDKIDGSFLKASSERGHDLDRVLRDLVANNVEQDEETKEILEPVN